MRTGCGTPVGPGAPRCQTREHHAHRTDIYALGCVFFQMLTAKIPYERENSVAELFAHVHDPVERAEPCTRGAS